MDYSKLSAVTDSVRTGKPLKQKATAAGLKVKFHENPLNEINLTTRVTDSKKKLMIMDTRGIRDLMNMSREDMRKFLARLTDSDRRRVLNAIKTAKHIADGGGNQLAYILLDDLLANVQFDPSKFNVQALDDFTNTQEYAQFDENTQALIGKIKNDEFDPEIDSTMIDSFVSHLPEGHKSRLKGVITASTDTGEGFDMVEPEDTWSEEDNEFSEFTDAIHEDVASFVKSHSLRSAISDAESTIAKYLGKRSYKFVSDAYWEEYDKAVKEQFGDISEFEFREQEFKDKFGFSTQQALDDTQIADTLHALATRIKDDEEALDTIEESDFIDDDGNVVQETEDTPIVTLLTEALNDFADGDDTKLQELVNKTISTEEESEDFTAPEEPDEEEDVAEPETDEALTDSCIKFARRFAQKKSVNKLYDALRNKVPAFKSVNYRVADCEAPIHYDPQEAQVIDMPLTHDEFAKLCPPVVPDYIGPLVYATYGNAVPSSIESYEVDGPCVKLNGNQNYLPTQGTAEELVNRLKEAERENWTHIIGSYAVPLADALHILAMTGNLHVCDGNFYKKSLSSNAWTFDQVPDSLKSQGITSQCTLEYVPDSKVQGGGTYVTLFGCKFFTK